MFSKVKAGARSRLARSRERIRRYLDSRRKSAALTLDAGPSTALSRILNVDSGKPLAQHVLLFDADYYLHENKDVADSGASPFDHYMKYGWREGRNPHPWFDTAFYLATNADVAATGAHPLLHYIKYGWREGRNPHPDFDTYAYTCDHPDIETCGINPLLHFVLFGKNTAPDDLAGKTTVELTVLGDILDHLPFAVPQATKPDISIVIPVYNQIEMTIRCLHALSLHHTRHPFEVIVVDDHSNAMTQTALSNVSGIVLIRQEAQSGFVRACNAGAARAKGRFLAFVNNDTYVQPGWLDELVAAFDILPDAGAVGSALIYPDGSLQEAGAVVWNNGTALNIGRGRDPDSPRYTFAREVDYCSAASLMIRTELFQKLGGFDLLYAPAYYEDTDLCMRVRQAGFKVYCQPHSRIVHVEGGTAGRDLTKGMKQYQIKNRGKFINRWRGELDAAPPPPRAPFNAERFIRRGQRRVLMLDDGLPDVKNNAGAVVTFEFIKLFQSLGYQVVFGASRHVTAYNDQVRALERIGVEVLRAPYHKSPEHYLESNAAYIDVVFAVRYVVAETIAETLKRLRTVPHSLFLTADLHYLRAERRAALSNDRRLIDEAAIEKERELAIVRQFDLTITHSTFEQALLRTEAPGRSVEVMTWIGHVSPEAPSFASRRDILFVGSFGHAPNADAIAHFVANEWQTLKEKLPDARLRIVGSGANENIRHLAGDRVDVLGFVKDLEKEMDSVRVAIAPLRFGAGVKGKVATCMAVGLPNVTTPIGAEGMGLRDGETCLIADLGASFTSAVARLYNDQALWQRISDNSRAFVSSNWSHAQAEIKLINILHKVGARPTFTLSDRIESRARLRPQSNRS